MKKLVLYVSGLLLIGAVAVGCGRSDAKDDGVEITQFAVNEVIMTANQSYRAVVAGDTVYLDQYVSVVWPKAFGDANLKVLRDSLMSYCFGDTAYAEPEEAIRHFISDTSVLTNDVDNGVVYESVERVDSLPTDIAALGCYSNNVTAMVMEMDEEMVTYQVSSSSYLGGAHPFTTVRPFTYDFDTERVLTLDNMFTAEGRDSIMPVIVNAIARQLDVPVSGLDRAGIFSAQLTYPGMPYIYNNMLYFHYNPYDIAPYSSGMIDVAVYPYEVERYLKPEIVRLFDMGI